MKLFHITLSPFLNLRHRPIHFPVSWSVRKKDELWWFHPFLFFLISYLWMERWTSGMNPHTKQIYHRNLVQDSFYYGVSFLFSEILACRIKSSQISSHPYIPKYLPLPWRSTLYPVSFGWGIKTAVDTTPTAGCGHTAAWYVFWFHNLY